MQKISGVKSANVNFMTTKMVIEADDARMPDVIIEATTIVKKLEPDVEVRKV